MNLTSRVPCVPCWPCSPPNTSPNPSALLVEVEGGVGAYILPFLLDDGVDGPHPDLTPPVTNETLQMEGSVP